MLQLLLALSCLLPLEWAQAAFLQECEGVIIRRIPNPNLECSEYVYCDGDDSYYCNGECTEAVSCYANEQEQEKEEQVTTTRMTTLLMESTAKSSWITELPPTTPSSSSSSRSSSSTPGTTSSTTISTTIIRTTTAANPQAICKSSGQNGVYPYPANDNYYYQCLAGYLLLQQCPQHFHFSVAQGQCISSKSYQL